MAEGGCGRFTRRTRKGADPEVFELPNITEIDFTIGAQLTELPTIIYGAENNFVMDLGTYKQYEIQVERASPSNCDDTGTDPTRWSNGKWYQELEKFWDFWQNLTYDKDGSIRGGLGFEYDSAQPDLYPSIKTNVFLTGSMSPSFSVQQLKVGMTLLVARAEDEEIDEDRKIATFHVTDTAQYEVSYPIGSQMGLSVIPSDKQSMIPRDGSIFKGWRDEEGIVHIPSDGAVFVMDKDRDFFAEWTKPYLVRAFANPGEYEVEVPSGDEKPDRIIAYILGGGGAGGHNDKEYGEGTCNAGGGGGSGQFTIYEFRNFEGGDKIKITVGDGGDPYKNGNRSSVDINTFPVYAEGGFVGTDGVAGVFGISAKGGQKYVPGGTATNVVYPGKADDGGFTEGLGQPGKGGQSYNNSTDLDHYGGGGGGGAANLNHILTKIYEKDCNTDGSEVTKYIDDTLYLLWEVPYEFKYNCNARTEGWSLHPQGAVMRCTPINEGYFAYKAVIKNSYSSSRHIYTLAGIYAKSSGSYITFQSIGGDGTGMGQEGGIGVLGGGGGGSCGTEFSYPGGPGLVALLYIKDENVIS